MLDMNVPETGYTPDIVAHRLSEAGKALLALRVHGLRAAEWRSTMPVPDGTIDDDDRPAPPSSRAISAMDQALSWVNLIPADRMVLRHLVNARLLTSPRTGKAIYSWRDLGQRLGCSHPTAKTWWLEAIGMISRELNRPLFCQSAVFGGTRGLVPQVSNVASRTVRRRVDELDLVG